MRYRLFSMLIISFLLVLTSVSASGLDIKGVEMDSIDKVTIVKPGELLRINFAVRNEEGAVVENVKAEMWFEDARGSKLKDNEGSAINPDFNLKDIEAGDEAEGIYRFTIPWDVDDGDKYTIYIEVEGKQSETGDTIHSTESFDFFTIDKDNHELFIRTAGFEPYEVGCPRATSLHLNIQNIGKQDENDVKITGRNINLGVIINEEVSITKDPDEEENVFETFLPLHIVSSLNPGKYPLFLTVDYGTKEASLNLNVSLIDVCGSQPQGQGTADSGDSGSENPDSGTGDGSSDSGSSTSENLGGSNGSSGSQDGASGSGSKGTAILGTGGNTSPSYTVLSQDKPNLLVIALIIGVIFVLILIILLVILMIRS